jgi:hypothetical protein
MQHVDEEGDATAERNCTEEQKCKEVERERLRRFPCGFYDFSEMISEDVRANLISRYCICSLISKHA